ncbi:AAA family ATPase [Azospirillum sp.]|uniref:bifunctional aminoglycoside phosphotransferase/ATP-binding protein n=1 Tax=Azospirillum sp. TaxID=34012 RepID=UPI003D710D40
MDTSADQTDIIAFLGDPRSHGGRAVERIDTHAALVFLAGSRAYKLKRAVRLPYLDFSTPERRRAACEAELALNRRAAPDLYERVEAVVRRADGRLALGGAGEALDWVVVMRRFDSDQLFDRLADCGALTPDLMRRLAEAVAAFHDRAVRRPDGGGAAAMRAVVSGNLEELRHRPDLFPPERVARLAGRSEAALAQHAALLDARARGGLVRHCHGDLHLRNIVLHRGRPTLFDCIEFDESFAVIDVLYDLAFLLMDLDHRGLRPLGNAVFNRYLEATGDLEGLALLPLFLATRAAVRAKIDATAAAVQPDPASARALEVEAAAYLEQAVAALEPPPPRLMAVGGLSGTGKTTLARGLAPDLGAAPGALILRSDALRKQLMQVDETVRLPADAYTPAATQRVYAELGRRAGVALAAGHAVLADAVYSRPEERAAIEAAARRAGVAFQGLWLEADLPARVGRVDARRGDASDATAAVVRAQQGYETGNVAWARLDAGGDPAAVLHAAKGMLG